MRGSKPDSNGSQKLLNKEVSSASAVRTTCLLSITAFSHIIEFCISEL